MFLGKAKGLLDFTQERRYGKPDEEGNEKSPPGAMECTHVGAGKRAKLDFLGLVILVRVNFNEVSIILLVLGL